MEVTLSERAQFTLPAHFETKPRRVCFSLCIALVFLSFSYFVFARTFFTLEFVKPKEKHLKCERIWKLSSYFYFLRLGWRKWNFTSLATRANARINRLMLKGPLTDLFEPLQGKIYSHITSSFLVTSELFPCVLTFSWSATLVMTSSGHAHGHVTNIEKTQRLPGKLLYRNFFHWFNILI